MRFSDDTVVRIERAYGALAQRGRVRYTSRDYRVLFLFYLICKGTYDEQDITKVAERLKISEEYEHIKTFLKEDSRPGVPLNLDDEIQEFVNHLSTQPATYTTSPLMVTFWITNACNLRCRHCGNSSGERFENELSTEEILQIIEQLRNIGVIKLSITGGEPLVRKDVFQILRKARNEIPRVSLTTNGWFTAKRSEAQKVSRFVDTVKVSLDGLTAHDWIRGKGSFERAVQSIKNFLELGVGVKVQTTVMRQNYSEIIPLLEFLKRETPGIYKVDIVPLSIIGRATKELMINPLEYRNLLNKLRTLRDYPFKINVIHTFDGKNSCQALKTTLDISYDGTVYPCSFLRIPLGNLREEDILSIWNSEKSQKIRKLLSPENLLTFCPDAYACNGGCAANGVILGTARLCDRYCWRRWDCAGSTSKNV